MLNRAEIEERFSFTEQDEAGQAKHQTLREWYIEFASKMNEMLPEGRAKAVALTTLEDAAMWSHKALANGKVGFES